MAWQVDYAYAPTGELLQAVDSQFGRRHYQLDAVGRVAGTEGAVQENYDYDAASNITSARWTEPSGSDGAQGRREYAGTLLVRAGTHRYLHDAAGRVVRRVRHLLNGQTREWRFTWGTRRGVTMRVVIEPAGERIITAHPV